MLEVVAAVTVVFVGYVLYEVFKTVSQSSNPAHQPPAALGAATPRDPSEQAIPAAARATKLAEGLTSNGTEAGAPAGDKAAATEAVDKGIQLQNPITGEQCSVPSNYRFAKKWVKEALVAEGLLDKVYKNADLDEEASRRVKDAIDKLKVMGKYHA